MATEEENRNAQGADKFRRQEEQSSSYQVSNVQDQHYHQSSLRWPIGHQYEDEALMPIAALCTDARRRGAVTISSGHSEFRRRGSCGDVFDFEFSIRRQNAALPRLQRNTLPCKARLPSSQHDANFGRGEAANLHALVTCN